MSLSSALSETVTATLRASLRRSTPLPEEFHPAITDEGAFHLLSEDNWTLAAVQWPYDQRPENVPGTVEYVLFRGWIEKQGHGAIKNWRRRYAVLTMNAFLYFEKEDCVNLKGHFPFHDILAADPSCIQVRKKPYHIRGENAATWADVIVRIIDIRATVSNNALLHRALGYEPIDTSFIRGMSDYATEDASNLRNSHSKWSVVHAAADKNDAQAIKALTSSGLKVDDLSIEGDTPFLVAVRAKNYNAISVFLEEGCDVHSTNKAGKGALDVVVEEPGKPNATLKIVKYLYDVVAPQMSEEMTQKFLWTAKKNGHDKVIAYVKRKGVIMSETDPTEKIELPTSPFKVTVHIVGDSGEISIPESALVKDLEQLLEEKFEIPVEMQRVHFEGRCLWLKENRVVDYGIREGDSLYCTMPLGSGEGLFSSREDTEEESPDEDSVPFSTDSVKELPSMKIWVQTNTGETVTLNVKKEDTIAMLKENIRNEKICSEESLGTISFLGKTLRNDDTVEGAGIENNATLFLWGK